MSINTLSIDDLFDTNDLFESAAHYEASLAEVDTPVAEKIRIRAYSAEYYEWIGQSIPMPEKSPEIKAVELIKASSNGKACRACDGTGLYRIHKHNKDIPCAKCAGKGYITPIDEARSKAYTARRNAGLPMDASHTDYIH
ncbi:MULTISPECIES: hypothetical protein [unclassified Pseudoalteromonas]|uniref:hypothetical protein n=1 Tax=unclassified Pseudoalteromonas TaxID=194690 RepID=UPI00202AF147|nr:hypothetical protein [Pseudoalteromonas sp. SCSIO 43088]URQ88251.1 hypothetical protein J8Z28_20410 [Pseudoalteromonas sp. SCSIO 43088]